MVAIHRFHCISEDLGTAVMRTSGEFSAPSVPWFPPLGQGLEEWEWPDLTTPTLFSLLYPFCIQRVCGRTCSPGGKGNEKMVDRFSLFLGLVSHTRAHTHLHTRTVFFSKLWKFLDTHIGMWPPPPPPPFYHPTLRLLPKTTTTSLTPMISIQCSPNQCMYCVFFMWDQVRD
jgi:hypothetical protein